MTVPTYLPYFMAAGTVVVLIAIFYGLNRALVDAHWLAADRRRTLRVSAVILLGWLAAAIIAVTQVAVTRSAATPSPSTQKLALPVR